MCLGNASGPALSAGFCLLLSCMGCQQDMADQPRVEPLEASRFFANGMSARPLVEGTVARGNLQTDPGYDTGMVDGKPLGEFPLALVAEQLAYEGSEQQRLQKVLSRGEARFNIYCAPCHGRAGNGDGMVVQRGFPAPPTYHSDRLRRAEPGYFYDVITRGFGRMPSYAEQIAPADRWAIVAYLRALQLSQQAPAAELSEEDLKQLNGPEVQP